MGSVVAKVASATVLTVALLWPIPYTAAPAWEVCVVDEAGEPIKGMKVRLSYQNYSTESNGHELDAITNSQGRVYFPLQESAASIGRYIIYSVWSATTGVHASLGRHAGVFTFGQGRDGVAATGNVVVDWTGSPREMKSRIVAKLRPGRER